MKNVLPKREGVVAMNRARPSTGGSNMISMLSEEKVVASSCVDPSTAKTFFKFDLRISSVTG